jgi:hypothetical protein
MLAQRRGGNFNDDDVADVCAMAIKGLVHGEAA